MGVGVFLIGVISLGITLLAGVIALIFISGGAREEARRIYRLLDERYSRLENDLRRAQDERSEAQQEARRLEERLQEERPERLEWELQRASEELERWRQAHLELQQQLG